MVPDKSWETDRTHNSPFKSCLSSREAALSFLMTQFSGASYRRFAFLVSLASRSLLSASLLSFSYGEIAEGRSAGLSGIFFFAMDTVSHRPGRIHSPAKIK